MTKHGIHVIDPVGNPLPFPARLRLWDCGVTWRDLNPAPGKYVWDRLDHIVADGGRPLLVLGGTPQWAAANPHVPHFAPWVGEGSNSIPKTSGSWKDFVVEVAYRYRGKLDYQIWNEPQLPEFFFPYADIKVLAEMTKIAHRVIKDADPNARVAAAPILPRPSSGGIKRGSRYLIALREVGWPVDAYAMHAYPETNKGPSRVKWMVDQTQSALSVLQAPKKPLWVTEINFNLLGGNLPNWKIDPYMKRTDAILSANGVSRAYWYAYGHGSPSILGISFTSGETGLDTLQTLNKQ